MDCVERKGDYRTRSTAALGRWTQVLADGKSAIPILIAQLTDRRRLALPIYDYWRKMTARDVAWAILTDLFTDQDGTQFTMPGLDRLKKDCRDDAEACQDRFINLHGRRFVQKQWLAAWRANRNQIDWDPGRTCFDVRNS